MPRLDRSERHALIFHAIFATGASAVLAASVASLGLRIWALVIAYNVALPVVARLHGHRKWLALWLFLVPLSALQVLPDWILSAVRRYRSRRCSTSATRGTRSGTRPRT